jgi:hypothetical protein
MCRSILIQSRSSLPSARIDIVLESNLGSGGRETSKRIVGQAHRRGETLKEEVLDSQERTPLQLADEVGNDEAILKRSF